MKDNIRQLRARLLHSGKIVKTKNWQGLEDPPSFLEILHVSTFIKMIENLDDLKQACNPFLPWADLHFEERIGGIPLNPPPSHKYWLKGNEKFMSGDKFSHSYPERFWSKSLHKGIRSSIGDLGDLIKLLKKDPTTRQAYLPIYFPEDINAATINERIPCTLGYHFIIRNGQMDVTYLMRSCDVLRHMHNDLYLTNRLAKFVRFQAGLDHIKLGNIHFVVTSLHCFENDKYALKKSIKDL